MTEKEYIKYVREWDKKYPISYEGKYMFDPSLHGGYFCRYCGCSDREGCNCNYKEEKQ